MRTMAPPSSPWAVAIAAGATGVLVYLLSRKTTRTKAKLIDGKAIAATVRLEVKEEAEKLEAEHGCKPGLAVVLVGSREDSKSYVNSKKKAAAEVGIHSVDVTLPEDVSQAQLLAEIEKLNADAKVHAILVQLP